MEHGVFGTREMHLTYGMIHLRFITILKIKLAAHMNY